MPSVDTLIILLTFIGPALIVLPIFEYVRRLIVDNKYINQVENARIAFLHFDPVSQSDDCFTDVVEAIRNQSGKDLIQDLEEFHPVPFGVYGGGGGRVYLLDKEEAQQSNPLSGDRPEDLESILLIDEWLRSEISEKSTRWPQRIRYIGFICLLAAFVLQVSATV